MFSFPDHMQKVFRDDAMQAEFEQNGYVIVPFYTQEEVQQLLKLYEDLHPKDEQGFYPSTFSQDKTYRETADTEITKVGARTMNEILCDFKVINGSYIVKFPGDDSGLSAHQDMTLVDETKYTGINIWCPLVDLTTENGALFILKGSHRLFPTYRGAAIPTIYDEVAEIVPEYMEPVYLKAGTAVIFDQSIVHGSPPNYSDVRRPVTNIFFTHKDAGFRIAWWDSEKGSDQVELFEMADDFMTTYEQFGHDIYARPRQGESIGEFHYDFPKISKEQLDEKYTRNSTWVKTRAEADNESVRPDAEQQAEMPDIQAVQENVEVIAVSESGEAGFWQKIKNLFG